MTQKKIVLKHKNGDKLVGIFTRPKTKEKVPILILCHGLFSHKNSNFYVRSADYFKDKINTIRFDLRCHSESDGQPVDLTLDKSVEDLELILEYVKKLDFISDIYLFGSSYTGMVSTIITSKHEEIKLLGLRAPVSDWAAIRESVMGPDGIAKWKKDGYILHDCSFSDHDVKCGYKFYQSLLPYKDKIYQLAAQIKCPTLIVQGDADQSVPIEFTKRLYNSLTCPKEFKIIKGANHPFDGKTDEMLKYFTDFFEKYEN